MDFGFSSRRSDRDWNGYWRRSTSDKVFLVSNEPLAETASQEE